MLIRPRFWKKVAQHGRIIEDALYLNLLLDTVLQFNLVPLISYLDINKHSDIVEHINWVLSELSVGVRKMLNRIGRPCISLL